MYVDLTLMKLILGIEGNLLDTLITFYINSATQRVINIIGRDISEQTLTIKESGNDSIGLYVGYKPIQEITSVLMNDIDITSDVVISSNTNYIIYTKGFKKLYSDIIKTSSYSNEYYTKKELTDNITIEGTFGYSEIPIDIQDVVSNIVQNSYIKSGICPQVKNESVENNFGKESKTYFDIIKKVDISNEDMKTLIKYR